MVPTPYALFDGKPHTVFRYAIDAKGGMNPLLGDKPLTCAASPPASVKRHITSPAVLTAWGFVSFVDQMPPTYAAIGAFGPGVDLAAAPALIRADDKSPEVCSWMDRCAAASSIARARTPGTSISRSGGEAGRGSERADEGP